MDSQAHLALYSRADASRVQGEAESRKPSLYLELRVGFVLCLPYLGRLTQCCSKTLASHCTLKDTDLCQTILDLPRMTLDSARLFLISPRLRDFPRTALLSTRLPWTFVTAQSPIAAVLQCFQASSMLTHYLLVFHCQASSLLTVKLSCSIARPLPY